MFAALKYSLTFFTKMKTLLLLMVFISLPVIAQLSPSVLNNIASSGATFQKLNPTDCKCDISDYSGTTQGFYVSYTLGTETSYEGFNQCSYSAGVNYCSWLHVRNNTCNVTVRAIYITIYRASGASTFGLNDAYTQWGNCCWRDKWTIQAQEGTFPTLNNCGEYSWTSFIYDVNQDGKLILKLTPPDGTYWILPMNHFMVSICGVQAIDLKLIHTTNYPPGDNCEYTGLTPTTDTPATCGCEATTSCRGQNPPQCIFEL
jgi:hypothetical protein